MMEKEFGPNDDLPTLGTEQERATERVSADELLAYLADDLSSAEEEALQGRLSRDPEATRLLLDMADPSRLTDDGESGWQPLRDALRAEGILDPAPRPIAALLRPYYPLATAALLVLCLGLGFQLARQTGANAERDVVIWELLPQDESGRRDGDEAIGAEPDFEHDLVLYANEITPDERYRLSIVDSQGRVALSRILRTNAPGRIVLRLKPGDLEDGLYRMQLFSENASSSPVAIYRLPWNVLEQGQ